MNDDAALADADALLEKHRKKEESVARQKAALLACVAGSRMSTQEQEVAWILNHHPDARDSDIALQIHYWWTFQREIFDGKAVEPQDLYKLARLTTLARARAKIQNTYLLFLASDDIRKRRGKLAESEHDKQRNQEIPSTGYTVFADESGKGSDFLLVGSMWILEAGTSRDISAGLDAWRSETGFNDELHFSRISDSNIDRYLSVLPLLHAAASTVSFRALYVPRRGISDHDGALEDLFFHLLRIGVEQESKSRAPLPRRLTLWKDAEEQSRDFLMLTNLRTRLLTLSATQFERKLHIDVLLPHDSKEVSFLQFADLFTGAVGRRLNTPTSAGKSKDRFSEAFFRTFGFKEAPLANSFKDVISVEAIG